MATQTLNTVQRNHVNETVRPAIERVVGFLAYLDDVIDEMDNQQDAITASGDDLGDGADGAAPRTDAPVLNGNNVAHLRTFLGNMRGQVSDVQRDVLIALMVRPLAQVVRN